MSGELNSLAVLVTGASKGIGLATARLLGQSGAWVGMVARGQESLRRAADEVGGVAFVADLTSASDVGRLSEEVLAAAGQAPDVIVNSAGIFSLSPFVDTTPDQLESQFRGNLLAPFLATRAFLPAMIDRGSGHIINVGSIAARLALPGNGAYSASKFGLRGLHEVLAAELQGSGIRTTMIEPAATDTPLWDTLDPDARDDLPDRSQMMRPEAVARAILFTISQPAELEISYLAMRASSQRQRIPQLDVRRAGVADQR